MNRLPNGMVVLYSSTGHRFERWPVDAREMLATGQYTTEHTADLPSRDSGDTPAVPVAPTLPHEHSPGVPLVVSRDATPAKPSVPVRSRGKR